MHSAEGEGPAGGRLERVLLLMYIAVRLFSREVWLGLWELCRPLREMGIFDTAADHHRVKGQEDGIGGLRLS